MDASFPPAFTNLETLLNAYPDISAHREKEGTIWVTEKRPTGPNRMMTVRPIYEEASHMSGVKIEVRDVSETQKYSPDHVEIIIKPNSSGTDTVSIVVDESNRQLNSPVDVQKTVRDTRIGLSFLQVLGELPEDDLLRSVHAGRVNDLMKPGDVVSEGAPEDIIDNQQREGAHPVSRTHFLAYSVQLLNKMPDPSSPQLKSKK